MSRDDPQIYTIEALQNLARVVPAEDNAPLFSWRNNRWKFHPMVKDKVLHRIKDALNLAGWPGIQGHSFRIGGASYFLAKGVNPEIVRIAGHWRLLAYETYIQGFEQAVSKHMNV
jgi:hypothetical protein